MANWFVSAKKADFNKIADDFGISPMLARIIRNRNIIEKEEIEKFLYGTLEDLHRPDLLKDIEIGTEIIRTKIKEHKKIRVIGDYDIDGVCATYILKKGLVQCRALVDAVIPHRIHDGYGLNEQLIKQAYQDGIDTIITCDNGIAAYEQIAYANSLGMTVVITDHHEIPYEEMEDGSKRYKLPLAAAIINPKQKMCSYPYKSICGAVVAYKFVQFLLDSMKLQTNVLAELLEFASIATIGDVMPILNENRIIVKYGLASMVHTKNKGLKALIAVNGLSEKILSPYHIGFVLGPCLNATGRLDTASRALQLFEAETKAEAAMIASDLKAMNDSRKDMTERGVENAIQQIEKSKQKEDKVLVIYLPDCHESLAGIIAGRIRERYHKPTFVLTKGEAGIKGSGRSIEAYHMYEEMSKHKELFEKYGGHKLASGLSMKEENMEKFRQLMNLSSLLTEADLVEKIQIDIPMPLRFATKEFTDELSLLEPFGVGNQKPLFAQKNVRFLSGRILGQNKNVGKFIIEDEYKNRYDAVYFGDIEKMNQYMIEHFGIEQKNFLYEDKQTKTRIQFSICYYPEINEFRGNKHLQIIIKDYR